LGVSPDGQIGGRGLPQGKKLSEGTAAWLRCSNDATKETHNWPTNTVK
jgi:hypothetical protein